MFLRTTESGWVIHAPAKINLALEVLGRQYDGFHQVETLLSPVRWFDSLSYHDTTSPFSFSVSTAFLPSEGVIPTDQNNLAVRATEQLAGVAGRPPTGHLHLHKRIPTQAGLGGGSSDAAAALLLANRAWGLNYSHRRLEDLAIKLGTDVPFFLRGGAALGTGRGEQIEPTPIPSGVPLVVVKPPVGLPTPQVFGQLNLQRGDLRRSQQASSRCRELAAALRSGRSLQTCGRLIRNCLQPAAAQLTDWIDRIAHAMAALPVAVHQMTGSGSSFFAICRTWMDALRLASNLRVTLTGPGQQRVCAVATRTCV